MPNRIKELRKKYNITQDKLASIIGVSRSAISMYEIDLSEPEYSILKSIAEYFNVSVEYLMGGEEKSKPIGVKIPVLGTIPAGIPIEAIEEILDYEEISEDMAKHGDYFALKVKGDSMLPTIKEDDIVIIRQQDDAESGQICVVMINGYDATLKEIKKEPNGLWVLPHNPDSDFKPTFFSNEEVISKPVRVIGIAVEIRRSL